MQAPVKLSTFLLLMLELFQIKWVYADDSTVTLFLPLIPHASLVASVCSSVRIRTLRISFYKPLLTNPSSIQGPTATTYVIKCAPTDPNRVFCAIPPDFTLIEGPSTACYTVTQADVYVISFVTEFPSFLLQSPRLLFHVAREKNLSLSILFACRTSSLNCKLYGTTSAECNGGEARSGMTTPTSTNFPSTLVEAFFQPVVVTASATNIYRQ